jgi:hypothetical protein
MAKTSKKSGDALEKEGSLLICFSKGAGDLMSNAVRLLGPGVTSFMAVEGVFTSLFSPASILYKITVRTLVKYVLVCLLFKKSNVLAQKQCTDCEMQDWQDSLWKL